MKKNYTKLGVNIDHIATLRNARNDGYLDIIKIVRLLKKYGVDSITVHLREDRRHIKDADVFILREKNILPLNLEMGPTIEMRDICLKLKPFACCIVPENREELTTEGGLNVIKKFDSLKQIIEPLKSTNIRISLFIEPCIEQIKAAQNLGASAIEIHTGKFANEFLKGDYKKELEKINLAVNFAFSIGLECHAGHGLNFNNVLEIIENKNIVELNVGYFIVAQSIFEGLSSVIQKFNKIRKYS